MTDIYMEGYDAFILERPLSDNPYPAESDDWEEWWQGWTDAKRDKEAGDELDDAA